MFRFALLGAALSAVLASASAHACQVSNATGYPILKVHSEVRNGLPSYAAYYFGATQVITVSNLDKPDMQLIKKTLDDAFAQGKKLTYLLNSQASRNVGWLDVNDNQVSSVYFCDIVTADGLFIRFK